MILKKLSILNYKNIRQAEVAFSPKMNCFFGNNGMGKTNLLDVIYYLSFCKSYLNTPESLLINNDEELCVLQGTYFYEGRDEEIFCSIRRKQRKQFKRNKKEYGSYWIASFGYGIAGRFGIDTGRERRASPVFGSDYFAA